MADISTSVDRKVPGWEEALRCLVQEDVAFINANSSEDATAAIEGMRKSLFKIQEILASVVRQLIVPEDIGRNILSLTEGWENFWIDYDLFSAVQSSTVISGCNMVSLDAIGKDKVDVMGDDFSLEQIPENLRVIVSARRRLLKGVSSDTARLVLICARITAVDILLRQPRKSSVFLSSYFQSFPSFICQVASVANLMASRAVATPSCTSIESMIAYAGMSLLSTVITETNHVTQALSVLSANNPHAGILANLINLTLSASSLQCRQETFQLSKAAIYVLMSSVQNARHPSTVANSTMIRRILEVLIEPDSHPEVTHACCVCLEVALEFCHNSFSILFRDLSALDKLIDRGNAVLGRIIAREEPLASYQKALNSIFGLLRFSFQAQEINVGINLHEKLSAPNSPLLRLLTDVVTSPTMVVGRSPLNGCLTLVGNVMADDPLIISSLVDVGLVETLLSRAQAFEDKRSGDLLASLFVAVGAVLLHESGAAKMRQMGDPIRRLVRCVASDAFENSLDEKKIDSTDEMRIPDDVGLVVGQTCDDVIRNRAAMKDPLIEEVVAGLLEIATQESFQESCPLDRKAYPGLRILFGGLLSTTEQVEAFRTAGGIEVLAKLLFHPALRENALFDSSTSRHHPLVHVFKQIAQRSGRTNSITWQRPLADACMHFAGTVTEMDAKSFSKFASLCLVLTSTSPMALTSSVEAPTGAYVMMASVLMRRLPDLFAFFMANRSDWVSTAWVAIKNYISTVAKNGNSLFYFATTPHGELVQGHAALNNVVVSGLLPLIRGDRSTEPEEVTECVDLLTRVFVEDKNHAIRPIAVLEFIDQSGMEVMTDLFKRFVESREDISGVSGFESFLILFERLTSSKRITNSPVTASALTLACLGQWTVRSLNVSLTVPIAQVCHSLLPRFLSGETKSLSSTSATALAKIFSHGVMLLDSERPNEAAPTQRRSKRARTKRSESQEGVTDSELLHLDVFNNDVLARLFKREIPLVHSSFIDEEDGMALGTSLQQTFLKDCLRLGDKGSCESSITELVQRHTVSVSIAPRSAIESKQNAVVFVGSVCLDMFNEEKSKSALSVVASFMAEFKLSNDQIVLFIDGITSLRVDSGEVVANAEWVASLLGVTTRPVHVALFEDGIPLATQKKFLEKLVDILRFIATLTSGSEAVRSVVHACLANMSILVWRKENVALVDPDVLLNLPAFVRSTDTAPMVTDILLSLIGSELISSVKLSKELDIVVGSEISAANLMEAPLILDRTVRDQLVVEKTLKQMFKVRRGGGGPDAQPLLVRDLESVLDYSEFSANPESADFVLGKLVKLVLESLAAVDKQTGSGLCDFGSPSLDNGTFKRALTVESNLLAITGLLSELSFVREVDERYAAVQDKYLNELVSTVGRALVTELSKIHDHSGAAAAMSLDPNVFKIVRLWFDCINRSSPWMTNEVLEMVVAELSSPLEDGVGDDAVLLRSFAYSGLVFMLSEEAEVSRENLEKLIPLLSERLKRGTEIETLCRFDSHLQLEGLYASIYALSSRLRSANKELQTPPGELIEEEDEGEDGDAEMSMDSSGDMDDDIEEGSEDGEDESESDSVEMPEEFEIDDGENDEEENVFSPESGGSSSSSNDDESEADGDEDEEDYGDEWDDGWSDYDAEYDVDWEEDDEGMGDDLEADEDVDDDGVIEGEMAATLIPPVGDIDIADYMMEPTGSPQLRPTASPGSVMGLPPPGGPPPLHSEAALTKAKTWLTSVISELEAVADDQSSSEKEDSEEEGPNISSEEEEAADETDLLNMTEEEQLAGLEGLSPEERASIQQALGYENDDDEMDSFSDDDMMENFDFNMLPPNVRIIQGGAAGPMRGGEMSLTLEVPGGLGRDEQANLIHEAMTRMQVPTTPSPMGGGPRKSKGSEFVITDEIPKQDVCEKLCRRETVLSEPVASALEQVGAVTCRSLMLRNQVQIKPTLERVLIELCLDPRSRNSILNNLFSSLLKFVYPASSPWTITSFSDDAMPPISAGVFDGGIHPGLARESRSMDVNAPGQCRSVGSGRIINMLKFIVSHVPRSRLWFSQNVVNELRSVADTLLEGRRTPERSKRRSTGTATSTATTPMIHAGGTTSSDGEGMSSLVRAISSQTVVNIPPRRINPLTVAVKTLSSSLMIGSPSHSFILMSLVLEILSPFPSVASDAGECDSVIRQSLSEDAIQLLCEFLVENKTRLRHMPEFDKAVTKTTQVLVSLCRDVKVREIVRQRLLITASRLVNDMLSRLSEKESSFSAVPLVRLFRTAKEAFGTRRVESGEHESFLDFAPAVSNIESLWQAIDSRLAAHNNLLLSAPSVAQQALQKRRRASSTDTDDDFVETNKIQALETIAKLIPLVELYLSAHDVSAVWRKSEHERNRPGRWSSEPATEKENVVARRAMEFIERHRKPINSMVKSRPSILNKAFAPLVAIGPHMLDFDNKRSFFRTRLRQTAADGGDKHPQLRLTVRREDVFRDSYAKLQIRPKEEWRGRLNITFQGEEGVDAGGLVREWFSILAREIFNPNYALFTPASGRPSTFLINPASSVNPDHIHYFKFCGRFIGKAVFDNQRIDAYFVRSFYKHMLGQEVTWRDMEATDPDYFKNLNWILENDMTDVDYYSFTVEENEFGKLRVVELVPNGENIRVTEQNKHEYVRLVCEHKLTKGIQEQLKAYLQGFHELIPEHIVGSLFDDKELEMLISGLPSIDLEDLKRNTDYVHYTAESDQIKWFWAALEKFTEDELAWFLQFVTGSTQVPLEGFKGLAGMHGPQRFSIHRIKAEDRLPTAHTCFNQLDLPDYKDYAILEAKLKQAVCEGHSGFGFI